MQCPVCKTVNLTMAERSGIEIDYCPQCRGVWLDRGELDKIIDRAAPQGLSATQAPAAAVPPPFQPQQPYPQGSAPYYKKRKREGFLGELFDFD
ncbi:zf-TFIIB domain-containing protein [Ramlibacter algicola]|uniref:Zf-TFIIB domain-containing protein n=1 Tax=Ramlibacter algicola TaxID=2795217 RepID=A0A934UR39_9BURK|nr:zf-TFIIB domain-containing protein [Ramlibacter algicola]MBK0392785.1 zf-TFIIB domain-containing protein [Ramlibacter algicola]